MKDGGPQLYFQRNNCLKKKIITQ